MKKGRKQHDAPAHVHFAPDTPEPRANSDGDGRQRSSQGVARGSPVQGSSGGVLQLAAAGKAESSAWRRLKARLLEVTRSKMVTSVLARSHQNDSAAGAAESRRVSASPASASAFGMRHSSFHLRQFAQATPANAPIHKVFHGMPRVLKLLELREARARGASKCGGTGNVGRRRSSGRPSFPSGTEADQRDSGAPLSGPRLLQPLQQRAPSSLAPFADTSTFGTFCNDTNSSSYFAEGDLADMSALDSSHDGDIEVFSDASHDELLRDLDEDDVMALDGDRPFMEAVATGGGGSGKAISAVSGGEERQHRRRRRVSNTGGGSSPGRTPYLSEMNGFIPEMREGMVERGMSVLRHLLYPRALLRARCRARAAATEQSLPGAVTLSPETFKFIEIFRTWPASAIQILIAGAKYATADNGEPIIFTSEPHTTGVFLITTGTAFVLSRSQSQGPGRALVGGESPSATAIARRAGGAVNTETVRSMVSSIRRSSLFRAPLLLSPSVAGGGGREGAVPGAGHPRQVQPAAHVHTTGIVSAPLCFGEALPLLEQAHGYTVRAITKCDIWVVSMAAYRKALDACPLHIREETMRLAFEHRNEQLAARPLTPHELRRHRMFSRCQDAVLEELSRDMVPCCVPRGQVLCRAGEEATRILFLISGTCALKREIDGELLHVANARPGSIIADTHVLYGTRHSATVVASTQCDMWALPKRVFDAVAKHSPSVIQSISLAFREARREQMAAHLVTFRDALIRFPLLEHAIRFFTLRDLVRLFIPKVYSPMSVLCSTATYCDVVIVLLKGRVTIGDDGLWAVGEIAGFTGIVAHRWRCPAICHETVETLELPMTMFEAFLRDTGVYEKVRTWCLHLMFPKAFAPETVQETAEMVSQLRSPPLYPVSTARTVRVPSLAKLPREELRIVRHGGSPDAAAGASADPKTVAVTTALGKVSNSARASEGLASRPFSQSVSAAPEKAPARRHHLSKHIPGLSRVSAAMWVRRIGRSGGTNSQFGHEKGAIASLEF